ncbi:hypothetical protein BHE74_00019951 [Ensete ventricosum]|nr:hypothetical protein BHE74_00019951 [Ensete ventricosum]
MKAKGVGAEGTKTGVTASIRWIRSGFAVKVRRAVGSIDIERPNVGSDEQEAIRSIEEKENGMYLEVEIESHPNHPRPPATSTKSPSTSNHDHLIDSFTIAAASPLSQFSSALPHPLAKNLGVEEGEVSKIKRGRETNMMRQEPPFIARLAFRAYHYPTPNLTAVKRLL